MNQEFRVLKENSVKSFGMASDFPPLRCEYLCWKRKSKTVKDNRTSCCWKSFPYGKRASCMVNYAMVGLELQRSGNIAVLRNPGPAKNQNCDLCYKCCRINQHGIQCDQFDTSFYQKGMNISNEKYILYIQLHDVSATCPNISNEYIKLSDASDTIKCITLYI